MKLEVVVIPVSDVDRAKRFYLNMGMAAGRRFRQRRLADPAGHASRFGVLFLLRQGASRKQRRAPLRD
jgi:catechol 2,3-dioxygenase-like lactoylglutathione lyase family enzyme